MREPIECPLTLGQLSGCSPAATAAATVLAARDGVHDVHAVDRLVEQVGRPVHTLDHAPSFNYVDESSLDAGVAAVGRSMSVNEIDVPIGPLFSLKAVRTNVLSLTLRVPAVPGAPARTERLLADIESKVLRGDH